MKTSKFTEAQIIYALRQAEGGTKVAEVCRKMGISEATRRRNLALIQLEEEVRRPRDLGAAPPEAARG